MALSHRDMVELLERHLHANTDYAIVFVSPGGHIEGWLGAAQRLFGHTAAEAAGLPFSVLFTEEDIARGLDRQELAIALAGAHSEDDRWHVHRDGKRFWGSGVMAPVCDDDGAIRTLCKILRDKTDVRTQIERLENKVAAREAEIAHRRALLATTVHELRNPLGPIMASLDVLKRAPDPTVRAKILPVLERQLEVLGTLVADLGRSVEDAIAPAALTLRAVELNAAVQMVVESLRPTSEAAGLAVLLLLPDRPIEVQADPPRLQQMLLNLLGNAIKYTPGGGHITVSASVEADMAIVRIEDDGVGISPTAMPHIFELFTRETHSGPVQGLGVGLAVVQQLAILHGGTVEARSAGKGNGSIFGLRLPLAKGVGDAGSR